MHRIIVTFYFLISSVDTEHICPKFISCNSEINEKSCGPNEFFRERVKIEGCCPGCVTLKGEGESCQETAECQPGLSCESKKQCQNDPNQACEYYKLTNEIWNKKKYWNPVCLLDGSFAPKQCKGERIGGKCFCTDKFGNRIFGEEEWSKAMDMHCLCSRLVNELNKISRTQVEFHCDSKGNFEPLQCDHRTCWCASPKTGFPYSTVVPMEMMKFLPCYNKNQAGVRYQRKCDSERHIQEKIKLMLENHGTKDVTLVMPKCNFDGSYHRVQHLKEKTKCVFINNAPLTEAVAQEGTNCNCAYDRHMAQQDQNAFMFDCQPNGNYAVQQIWNGKIYCVDSDGFIYSDDPQFCTKYANSNH
ncbi:hypothetical protein RUM43_008003 [Polyplax serrata]|uniref:Thyroglobulin type-1 domain-containing protein n=1 Tax=Polyplax serrata TaxID=468196 RepID=A0AAN8PMY7_POLSC